MYLEKFFAKTHKINLLETKETFLEKLRKFSYKNFQIWDLWDIFPYGWRMYYYDNIQPIFKPQNSRLRKSIPRTWVDSDSLLVDLNFEIVKIFYENEYKSGIVDWSADELHKEFADWLEKIYHYITIEKPQLEKDLSNSYPKSDLLEKWEEVFVPVEKNGQKMYEYKPKDETPYEIKYAEVIRLEKLIDDKNTEFLTETIKRRHFFWT